MTGRLRAVSISPTRLGRRIGGVLVSAIALCAVMAPAPAYAWWGWLEKMSGPSGLNGPQIEVRAVCFGDRHDDVKRAGSLAAEAARLTPIANRSKDPDWEGVADRWMEAATTWASILG